MVKLRNLSTAEIAALEAQGCHAENWNRILVKDPFNARRFSGVSFSGSVELGIFDSMVTLPGKIEKECGIHNCQVHNSTVGDNCYLANVGLIANYEIAENVVVENSGVVVVEGETSFGNGVELDILNEAGGRTLKIFDCLSAQMAYMIVFYRHHSKLLERLDGIIDAYALSRRAAKGSIGRGTCIRGTSKITNVAIGPFAVIEGALCLEDGTLQSSEKAPVAIGVGVILKHFIVLSGSKIDQSAILEKCFVGQSVKVGKQFSAENSAFFCNSELFHGEGCSVFAGPYTVSHHKSTLLIAGFFSFYNAGSGSNQSNHMYKLGPVHQGILERGSKTGSFSYLSWEARVGAFSTIIGKNYANFNTTDLPFSLIRESKGKTVCVPGWGLFTVGLRRDGLKWPARDGRKDTKLDLIHFQVLSPYVVGKIVRGVEKLKTLSSNMPEGEEYLRYNGVLIQRTLIAASLDYYETAIRVFIGDCVLRQLGRLNGASSLKEIREALSAGDSKVMERWVDVNGLLMPESMLSKIIRRVIEGSVNSIQSFGEELAKIHSTYEEQEWNWCAALIEKRLGKPVAEITVAQLRQLVEDWQKGSEHFNQMLLDDARKEFDADAKLSYGIDGDEAVRDADFSAVRGLYEENSFVKGVKKEVVDGEAKTKSALEFLAQLQ
ncbi:MAG: DUF4954 family protein [Bacteroidota bacterium]